MLPQYMTFLTCDIYFLALLIYFGRHKFFSGFANDWIIKILRILISLEYHLNFFHTIMKVIPTTASSINSMYKTFYSRSFITLWS